MTSLNKEISLGDLPINIKCRCLVYCATDDKYFEGAKASSKEKDDSKFVPLQNLNHLMAAFSNDAILPHVVDFLSE